MSAKKTASARKGTTARKSQAARKPVSGTPAWVGPAGTLAVIALLVASFLVIRYYTTPPAPHPLSTDTTTVLVGEITGLPSSEFDSVGQGTATASLLKKASGSALTGATGKPEVLFIGGEYCPYCAAERWPLIIALSRFGTFSGLQTTSSSSTDVFPNTPTFTFRSATYTSQYIDFRAVEVSDRNGNPLQTPTSAEEQLFGKYDSVGQIPFIDYGNRYTSVGAYYTPEVLGGSSWQAVAADLKDSGSAESKAVIGSANLITAAICRINSDQPAAVCSTSTIQGLETKLG